MSNSSGGGSRSEDFSQVPHRLHYNPPRKEDFPPRSSNWRDGLKNVLSAVESNQIMDNPIVLLENDKYVCTYDMYPKAKYHLLLMRRNNKCHMGDLSRVKTLNDLEPTHLNELREFHTLGRNIASRLEEFHRNETSNNSSITIKLGYHAIPSFNPLHLHIISSDLDSPCITKRDHIISFTSTLFFVEPESVERHLESAFVDSMVLSVRKERAQSVRENTPIKCSNCEREAVSVPDWKRHNQSCNVTISKSKKETSGGLNSLLGWNGNNASAEDPKTVEAMITTQMKKRGIKRSFPTDESGTIQPMTPTHFTPKDSKSRYIIYMAIREKNESKFSHGLAKCKDACHDDLKHCLQLEQTRHVTMYDGDLSANQVRNLKFIGELGPIKIELDGWKPWAGGAYLSLSEKSEHHVKRLLKRIAGLPPYDDDDDDEVKCDHLSIYRKRKETTMSFSDTKREFRKIRDATESHDWGSVDGVSIRIKAYGGGYNECQVLADASIAMEVQP